MKFFEIKNKTDKSFDLYFYGDIVKDSLYKWTDEDKCPKEVIKMLDEAGGRDLNIYINSDGGSVTSGLAIYHQIKRYSGHKTVFVDGLAASISSVIAFAGDELVMPENTYLMIHKPHGAVIGNAEDCRRYAELLDGMEETILNIYEENAKEGVKRERIKEMLSAETWLSGREAENIFNITVTGENKAVAYLTDENNLPDDAKIKTEMEKSEKELEIAKARLNFIKKIGVLKNEPTRI